MTRTFQLRQLAEMKSQSSPVSEVLALLGIIMGDMEEEFTVEKVSESTKSKLMIVLKVIDKRVGRNGKTEYLLKWRGFGDEVIQALFRLCFQSRHPLGIAQRVVCQYSIRNSQSSVI